MTEYKWNVIVGVVVLGVLLGVLGYAVVRLAGIL